LVEEPVPEEPVGKTRATIDDKAKEFLAAQRVFFVATAPRGDEGHVNLSPKGLDTLRVLSPTRIAYLDLVGSGAETIAHLRENGRITLMFCAFEGSPNILRIYGRGRAVESGDADWSELAAGFPAEPGARSIVVVDVERVMDSCGFGVPRYRYEGDRPVLREWAEKKGDEALREYERNNNAASLDGLPALRRAAPER
jgi:hypothetical protein